MKVDLPDPLGPSRPRISPRRTSTSTPASAWMPRKDLARPRVRKRMSPVGREADAEATLVVFVVFVVFVVLDVLVGLVAPIGLVTLAPALPAALFPTPVAG